MKPTKKQIVRHKDFIAANMESIAAEAWKGYQVYGRGAVVIWEKEWIHQPAGILGFARTTYLSERSPGAQEVRDARHGQLWPSEKEAMWVQTYDAEHEMLVLIVREDGNPSSYRLIVGNPTPPEAVRTRNPLLPWN